MNEGEKLSLKCHVGGSLPLTIQWMKDRRELKSSGNIRITSVGGTACLEVSSASKTDAGDYLCKVSNAAGTDFCKSRVTVEGNGVTFLTIRPFVLHLTLLLCTDFDPNVKHLHVHKWTSVQTSLFTLVSGYMYLKVLVEIVFINNYIIVLMKVKTRTNK